MNCLLLCRRAVIVGVFAGLHLAGPTRGDHPTTASRPADLGRIAVLHEPGMPIRGAASSSSLIADILRRHDFDCTLWSASQLADTARLDPALIDILVIPTGESFPSEARDSVVRFLHGGGSLITVGGYAFNHLLRKENGQWQCEADLAAARVEQACRKENSLLANGDFETSQELPPAGQSAPGQWLRTSTQAQIVTEDSREGRFAGKTFIAADSADTMASFWQETTAKPGATYQVSGWLKTQRVIESGYAFIAIYQLGAKGQYIAHKDFAQARGTTDWIPYRFTFTPAAGATRLQVKFGLFQTHGTAWFDDLRLADISGTQVRPMNTSTGTPADGLVVAPEQIGMFDASFPLKRACSVRPAAGQFLFNEPFDLRDDWTGWAASGVTGKNAARWFPLLHAYDRYNRPRGAAAAMLVHYGGYYAGSCWAYFGVNNKDLLDEPGSALAQAMPGIARFMTRKTFLRNLGTDHRMYRAGESVKATVFVDNRGKQARQAEVRFAISPADAEKPAATAATTARIQAGAAERIEVQIAIPDPDPDLWQIKATLAIDGEPVDEMVSGFVVERPEIVKAGAPLRFENNYFTFNGRPLFLFGTDTWNETYKSAYENPLTWSQDLRCGRDIGLNLYENLQYNNPTYTFSDDEWRDFRAMTQLTQKYRMVFMPGMLIIENVAVGEEKLAKQGEVCREYVRRLGDAPGLLWYVNGDYQMRLDEQPKEVRALWNRWLVERYGTTDRLRQAWGQAAAKAEIGHMDLWPPDSGRWNDAAATDRLRFQTWLTERWNKAHTAAVREIDGNHPITSEYYQIGWGGLDLIQTIDGLDVSNFGFFDKPETDLDILPLKIRYNDLRARGKGVALGEYGVKTHPAWTIENGAEFYHIRRTEEEQAQLFLAVAHYGLGMGVSKIQNWCIRDAQDTVFPWGLFYPNEHVPKDVAYAHRNQSILWRHFTPQYRPTPLTVCLANNLRLGNFESIGREVADRTFDMLLGMHHSFNVIDDDHLDSLPRETRVLIYPAPFALRDDVYDKLLAWVRDGGTLVVTGDFSYDERRQRTRTDRLKELAGVEFVGERYPDISRMPLPPQTANILEWQFPEQANPCIRIKPLKAEVIEQEPDNGAVLVRNKVGHGEVFFFTDPVELSSEENAQRDQRQLYEKALAGASIKPLEILPDKTWLHAMSQRTAHGRVYVVYNRRKDKGAEAATLMTAAGRITMTTRNRWPALAALTDDGKIVAVNAYGSADVDGTPLLKGEGLKAILSLDGKDLRESQAVLVAPFETGTLQRSMPGGDYVAVVGEFQAGQWTPLEQFDLPRDGSPTRIDGDRATGLILLCRKEAKAEWAAYLTNAMIYPDRIAGY